MPVSSRGGFVQLTLVWVALPVVSQQTEMGLSGKIGITLDDGLWKSHDEGLTYQDITLDLACRQNRCDRQVWGYAPQFNQADHEGKATLVKVGDRAWQLQVQMKIAPDPWRPRVGEANYHIEIQRENNQLSGTYSGIFDGRSVAGQIDITQSDLWPQPIAHHISFIPREHPRLIFRQWELAALRQKAKTPTGAIILTRLRESLATPPNYGGFAPNGGYHAAGHCFLSLLKDERMARASRAWRWIMCIEPKERVPSAFSLSVPLP
ncbi:MAG: hypothetical protein AB4290_26410 [Spirulina sp.]